MDGNVYHELATEISHLLHWADELPELILVGIGYDTDDKGLIYGLRQWDMTPTYTREYSGEAGEFLKFFQEEIIPHIDANYRTDPADRTIVGHSHGGLFSLYALFHAPETFDRHVAASPSLWWDDRVLFEHEQEFADEHSDLPFKLFLSVGELEEDAVIVGPDENWVSNLSEFHGRLEERDYAGLDMEMAIMEDESHGTVIVGALSKGSRTVF